MKIYLIPGAPNCRKVQAVASQLGLKYQTQVLDIRTGDTDTPAYRSLNPNGYTPTLVDGDFVLWESNAIMQYLCCVQPETDLFPNDAKLRADITRWQFWEQANLQGNANSLFRENFLKPNYFGQSPDPAHVEYATQQFQIYTPMLDRHLQGRRYMVGDNLTIADFTLAASFCYATLAKLPWESYSNIQNWYQTIDQMPVWHNTVPKNQK
ncbi:MAG: glutathione S-transferase family protein [Gammaproteobacteria bacterium]|nr:glutathione S-transferase family protein [Gammaproteobacteria bacterium]